MLKQTLISTVATVALIGGAWMLSAGGAQAISPSDQNCLDSGGTPTHEPNKKGCDYPDEPVNNDNASDKGKENAQKTSKDETWSGNDKNKFELNCSGPKGKQDPECP